MQLVHNGSIESVRAKKTFCLALPVIFILLSFVSNDVFAGRNLYVATSGSDLSGDGSIGTPWKTIGYGIGRLLAGDTLIVGNGIYSGKGNFIRNIPSGTSQSYTTIKAESPFSVRINRGTDDLGYTDSPLIIEANSYVHVEGIIFDVENDPTPPNVVRISSSDHIKVMKCIVKRSGSIDNYANIFSISQSIYVLAEDCAVVGAMRYGFYVGGTSDTSRYIIFRRCIVRNDYSNSNQPKASFAVYGNNTGYGVQDVLFQNCIALDGQNTGYNGGTEGCYGGFYNPKNGKNITYKGCIALNVDGVQGGMVVKEQNGTGIVMSDTVIWDCRPRGLRAAGSAYGLTINRCTIGGNPHAFHQTSTGGGTTLRNTLLFNNPLLTDDSYTWDIATHNAFSPASQAIGLYPITNGIGLNYITQIDNNSVLYRIGDDAGNIGATIKKKWGFSGALWGETGSDVLTGEDLWPWPNETHIKAVFSESNSSPIGATPLTNNTLRGFCASGVNPITGSPVTLTTYIWEYLGNPIPFDPGIGQAPTKTPNAPSGLTISWLKAWGTSIYNYIVQILSLGGNIC